MSTIRVRELQDLETDRVVRVDNIGAREVATTDGTETKSQSEWADALVVAQQAIDDAEELREKEGLKISQFLDTNGTYDDYTAGVQAALDAFMSNPKYRVLDFEGRYLEITQTLTVNFDLLGGTTTRPKMFVNGTLFCSQNWTGTTTDPLLSCTAETKSLSRSHWFGIKMLCMKRCSGIKFHGPTASNTRFLFCDIIDPVLFGIDASEASGGHGFYVINTTIERLDGQTPFDQRTTIGIDAGSNNDWKVIGCNIQYCKTGWTGAGSSYQLIGNHIYQGEETGELNEGYNPGIWFKNSRANSLVVGNYIDNCYVMIGTAGSGFAQTQYRGYIQILGNIFTMKDSGPNEYCVRLQTRVSDSVASSVFINNNQFRKFGVGGNLINPFVKTGDQGGSWNQFTVSNCNVSRNYFWGNFASNYSTTPVLKFDLDGVETAYPVDLTDSAPFGWPLCNYVTSIAVRTGGSSANPGNHWFHRTGNHTGNLRIENAVTGTASVSFSATTTDEW